MVILTRFIFFLLELFFFLFLFLLAQLLTFTSLGLPKIEPNREDPIMDQVLVGQELQDVLPTIRKLTENFNSLKLLFVEYRALMVNYE